MVRLELNCSAWTICIWLLKADFILCIWALSEAQFRGHTLQQAALHTTGCKSSGAPFFCFKAAHIRFNFPFRTRSRTLVIRTLTKMMSASSFTTDFRCSPQFVAQGVTSFICRTGWRLFWSRKWNQRPSSSYTKGPWKGAYVDDITLHKIWYWWKRVLLDNRLIGVGRPKWLKLHTGAVFSRMWRTVIPTGNINLQPLEIL